jgi:hypothetical protein
VTSGSRVQRLAEYLIRRACRRLPGDTGAERCREWAGELPAILNDPDVRPAFLRWVRALSYAAGISRTTRQLRLVGGRPRQRWATGRPSQDAVRAGAPVLRVLAGLAIWLAIVALFIGLAKAFQPRGIGPLMAFVLAAGAGFVIFCLSDLARADKVRYLPKWGWAIVCLTQVPLGGIMYLSAGRIRGARS